jgi:hypothetical protein
MAAARDAEPNVMLRRWTLPPLWIGIFFAPTKG